jgi:hypothetical protein
MYKNVNYSQASNGTPESCIWLSKSPSLKRSPNNLAAIREKNIGNPREMSPVASVTITAKLSVIRRIPPNVDTAPINAYLPGSILLLVRIRETPIPVKRPY